MGAGMPHVPTDAITEVAKSTMTTFTPYYIKGFALALIEQLKKEAEVTPNEFQLLDYALPTEPIKQGMLTKQGIVRKTWKDRHFVVYNAADNYAVHYYVDEAAFKANPDKPKGKISLCNMKVKKIKKEEEVKEYGEHCLKLVPYGRRRTWYVRSPDAETMKAWKAAFKYAARYAKPALNKDKVMRKAFKLAYRMTRWDLYVWSWYRYDQSEAEMLGQLVVDKCEQDIMGDVYAKIPSGIAYWKVRGMVEKTLDSTVGAVVGAAWSAAEKGVEASKDTLKAKAREALGPLVAKEVELKANIRHLLSNLLDPHTAKIGEVIAPAVIALAKPLYKAYRSAIKIFHRELLKAASGNFGEGLAYFGREVRWYYGVMWDASLKIRVLTRPDSVDGEAVRKMGITISIADVLAVFGTISLWRIEDRFEGNLRELMYKAIYTTEMEVKEGRSPHEATQSVIRKMIHDAKIQARRDVHFLLYDLVHESIFKLVKEPMYKVVEPIAELIPEPLRDFIDPINMAKDVLRGVISDAVSAVIEPGCASQFSKLNKLDDKLVV